jgi:tetratricopeptide (TPR) repeat protein
MPGKFDKFSEGARIALTIARKEAIRLNYGYIATEHILLGLLIEEDAVAAEVLVSLNMDLGKIRKHIEFIIRNGEKPYVAEIRLTPRAKQVILFAIDEAQDLGHNYVGTEHLLIALLHQGGGFAVEVLNNFGITLEQVRDETIKILVKNAIPTGHNQLGIVYTKQGKLDEAIEEYKKVLLINPNNARALFNLGETYNKQGKLNEAVEGYKKALSINPNQVLALINLGVAYHKQEKLDEAIEEYKKALLINPNYAPALSNLGEAYRKQGKLDEAIEEYKKALLINPNYALGLSNLGEAYRKQGKLDEAVEEYKKALLINPNYALALSNLGEVYNEQGKLDEAVEVFKKAIIADPNFAQAQSGLEIMYNKRNKLDQQNG